MVKITADNKISEQNASKENNINKDSNNKDDDGFSLVEEVLKEFPPEEKGEREEWSGHVGWHRIEDVHNTLDNDSEKIEAKNVGEEGDIGVIKNNYVGKKKKNLRGQKRLKKKDGEIRQKQNSADPTMKNNVAGAAVNGRKVSSEQAMKRKSLPARRENNAAVIKGKKELSEDQDSFAEQESIPTTHSKKKEHQQYVPQNNEKYSQNVNTDTIIKANHNNNHHLDQDLEPALLSKFQHDTILYDKDHPHIPSHHNQHIQQLPLHEEYYQHHHHHHWHVVAHHHHYIYIILSILLSFVLLASGLFAWSIRQSRNKQQKRKVTKTQGMMKRQSWNQWFISKKTALLGRGGRMQTRQGSQFDVKSV